MSTTTNTRPWTWTPPPAMNRVMSLILRLPLFHRIISHMILLITFTGRKSGKSYTTPVGYLQEDNTVLIMTKRFRSWWHNFEEPAPVTLLIRGKERRGQAQALTDESSIRAVLRRFVENRPREADIYGIEMKDGKPVPASLQEIAPKIVVIQVTLER